MRFGKLLLLTLLFSCSAKQASHPSGAAVEVTVYVVDPQSTPVDFTSVGVVQSSHQVQIRSAVQGELKKIFFTEGAFVKEGDPLFEIDQRVFTAKVKEAEANLESQQAALSNAKLTLDRLKPLLEQQAVSKKDIDDATAQLLTAQANVSKFKAQLDESNLNLNNATITSPISGYVSTVESQEGTLIIPSSSNAVLTTVSVLDPVYVELHISTETYLKAFDAKKKGELELPKEFGVTLQLADGSQFPIKGKVNFIAPLFDASTATLSARAIFSNPNLLLRPGLFVDATLHGAIRPNAILVPQEALQRGPLGFFVYVVDKEKKAELRLVTVGDFSEDKWVIRSGLKKGDKVIVTGLLKIKNGTPVKIKKSK